MDRLASVVAATAVVGELRAGRNSIGFPDAEARRSRWMFDQVDWEMLEGYKGESAADLGGVEQLAQYGYCQMLVGKKQSEESQIAKARSRR